MKTGNIVRGFVVALLALGTAAVARAEERVIVHIPFSFIVGTTQLPAGDYVITEDYADNQNVLAIESPTDVRRSTRCRSPQRRRDRRVRS